MFVKKKSQDIDILGWKITLKKKKEVQKGLLRYIKHPNGVVFVCIARRFLQIKRANIH